ncbi:hypothetical protein Ancab_019141 [Ancistrocladus abbreviatus]
MTSLHSALIIVFCYALFFSFNVAARRLMCDKFWPPLSSSIPNVFIPPVMPSPSLDNRPYGKHPFASTVSLPAPPPPPPTFPVFQDPLLPPVGNYLPNFPFPNMNSPTVPTMPSTMPCFPFPPGVQRLHPKKINRP